MENSPLRKSFLEREWKPEVFHQIFHQIFHQKIYLFFLGTWRIIAKGTDPWNLRNRKSSGFNGNIIYKWGVFSQISQVFLIFPSHWPWRIVGWSSKSGANLPWPSRAAGGSGGDVAKNLGMWKNLWVTNQLTRDIISYICSYIMHIALTHASYKIDIEYRMTYIYIHIHRDMYVNRRFARANDADKSGSIQVSIDILCVSAPHPGGDQW